MVAQTKEWPSEWQAKKQWLQLTSALSGGLILRLSVVPVDDVVTWGEVLSDVSSSSLGGSDIKH